MSQQKVDFLRSEGLLNPRSERVTHPLFETLDFFDPLDLPQVRYEMLRAARVEGCSVVHACRLLGFSREYFYRLERAFTKRGYVALLGAPMGRRPLIALNQEIDVSSKLFQRIIGHNLPRTPDRRPAENCTSVPSDPQSMHRAFKRFAPLALLDRELLLQSSNHPFKTLIDLFLGQRA